LIAIDDLWKSSAFEAPTTGVIEKGSDLPVKIPVVVTEWFEMEGRMGRAHRKAKEKEREHRSVSKGHRWISI
jgi:hypothetical protein